MNNLLFEVVFALAFWKCVVGGRAGLLAILEHTNEFHARIREAQDAPHGRCFVCAAPHLQKDGKCYNIGTCIVAYEREEA